ncbi:MAG: DUF3987 domain-containing protein [Planctomycetes bacterium]|nr:DUF3987 domain-containing protein [Planctomycetota bacterium]
MRKADAPAGWRKLKTNSDGGTVFRLVDESRNNGAVRRSKSKSRKSTTFQTLENAIDVTARKVGGNHVATWTYHYADGSEALYVARFNMPGGSKQFRPFHKNGNGYSLGDPPDDKPLPLYRLAEISNRSRVFIFEGEKCADAAIAIGLAATTSAHGSKSAAKTDWQPLAGKEVLILPDADEAGEHYANTVVSILHRLSPPAMVRILHLPDLPPGGDICEFIEEREFDAKDNVAICREIVDLAALVATLEPERTASRFLRFHSFPIDVLPEPVRSYVAAGAKAIGCDASYIALPMLSALASAIGNTHRLKLKRSWTEPAIIWTAIVGESGTSKSPALELALRAVRKRQHRAFKEYSKAMKTWEVDNIRWEVEKAKWKKDAASGKASSDPPEAPVQPLCLRTWTDDTTTEALVKKLQENPRGMLMVRDELAGWFNFDRYTGGKGGGDAAKWLEVFGGRALIVDRKTSGTEYVPRASVSIAGGIQPETLRRSLGQEHRDSGLAARLLFAMPPRKAKKWTEYDVDERTESDVDDVFDALYSLNSAFNDEGDPEPRLVRLSSKAKIAWVRFVNEHAIEQTGKVGDEAAVWSKLEGYAARFALVFHLTRVAACDTTQADADVLDEASIMAAVVLVRWFAHEAKRVYAILGDDEHDREHRRLVELIESKGGSVSIRDWQRMRSHQKSADAEAELKLLEEKDYGELRPAQQSGRGRPSKLFTLFPDRTDTDNNTDACSECSILSVSDVSGMEEIPEAGHEM